MISRAFFRTLVRTRGLPVIYLNGTARIPQRALEVWLAEQTALGVRPRGRPSRPKRPKPPKPRRILADATGRAPLVMPKEENTVSIEPTRAR